MVWNPFQKQPETVIGIDIGTSSVKVVELSKKGGFPALENYGSLSAVEERGPSRGSFIKTLDTEVAQMLTELFEATGIQTRAAIMAVPLFSSFSTLIELPAMSESELEQSVRFEARKYVPLPLSEVKFDWLKIDHLSTSQKFQVLTVAVPQEVINKYYRIAQMLNIDLKFIELEIFSMARALVGDEDAAPTLIIDIGARSTNTGIVEKGIATAHHNIETAGLSLSKVIARGMGVDIVRAEELKRTWGLEEREHNQVRELLAPFIDSILAEAQKVAEAYVQKGGGRPARAILTGSSVNMPGLASYVQQYLRIETKKGDPFLRIDTPPILDQILENRGPAFTVAAGLALRGVE